MKITKRYEVKVKSDFSNSVEVVEREHVVTIRDTMVWICGRCGGVNSGIEGTCETCHWSVEKLLEKGFKVTLKDVFGLTLREFVSIDRVYYVWEDNEEDIQRSIDELDDEVKVRLMLN